MRPSLGLITVITAFAVASIAARAQTFDMEFFYNNGCGNRAGTDCEDQGPNQCCNAATDDEGDPIGPWQASDCHGYNVESWAYTIYAGDQEDACDNAIGQVSGASCNVASNIQGGRASPTNARADEAENSTATNESQTRRNWIWSVPQLDGTIRIYKIRFGTPESAIYKRIVSDKDKEEYILVNWTSISIVDAATKRILRRITR